MSGTIKIFVQEITAHLVHAARRELELPKGARLEPAAIVVPQRFNSALGLSPHLHGLFADGVWMQARQGEKTTFHALPAPTNAEVSQVAWSIC